MNTKKKKGFAKIMLLVVSLIVVGVSGTYAYYTNTMTGGPSETKVKSGVFKVTSSLESANAINNTKMRLIDSTEKEVKAEKVTFTVTSTNESTVNGKYFIYLRDVTLSKNLYTNYLKWELVQNDTIIAEGNFQDAAAYRTDTPNANEQDNVLTSLSDIKLTTDALDLTKNTTDTLIFRMWLENDKDVNQIALTNGSFAGRLYLEAYPVSEVTGDINPQS